MGEDSGPITYKRNDMSIYKTYKFYDENKRRIAAFAREIDGGKMEIFLLFCSPRDNFSRIGARLVYSAIMDGQFTIIRTEPDCVAYKDELTGITYHPKVFYIGSSENPRKAFIEVMEANFYRRRIRWVKYEQAFLVKSDNQRIEIGKARPIYKMDKIW